MIVGDKMERLNKTIALSGAASRRKADELIVNGLVKVNGIIVTELGFKVKKSDEITINDKTITKANKVYFLLNKPTGYLSTTDDDKKRRKITDLLMTTDQQERVYPVGRLEYDTAGAIILTNDGELTKQLTNTNSTIEKEYLVRVKGIVIKDKVRQLRLGLKNTKGKLLKPKHASIIELDKPNQSTLLSLVLTNNTNKELKELIKLIGFEIKALTRVRYGELTLEGVKRGTYRSLKIHEIKALKQANIQ
jgi:23S rRNA pseudouridine2605 synthase